MSIKRETIEVDGTVMYCDGDNCGVRGPVEVGDSVDDVLNEARRIGWTSDDCVDLCPRCARAHASEDSDHA